jgi:hypothetical protein
MVEIRYGVGFVEGTTEELTEALTGALRVVEAMVGRLKEVFKGCL